MRTISYPKILHLLYVVLLFILFTHSQTVLAQEYRVLGIVQDNESQEAVPFASVFLFPANDTSAIQGASTLIDGQFKLQHIPSGIYHLVIQMIGYKEYRHDSIKINTDIRLNPIQLEPSSQVLEAVTVRAERSLLESHLGKKVLHIGQDLASSGQSIAEALDNLPSVNLNPQGGLSLRGSENVIIYINGQETRRGSKTLQNIPAEAIEKVEVITSPSARYDAEGVAGIINIVYRRHRVQDLQLEPTLSLTYPWRLAGGFNSSLNLNKIDVYANYNLRYSDFLTTDDQYRENELDSLQTYFNGLEYDGIQWSHALDFGLHWEADTSFLGDVELNYQRWDVQEPIRQLARLNYAGGLEENYRLENEQYNLEDELFLSVSILKKFASGSRFSVQLSAGGENEKNREEYNLGNLDIEASPFARSIRRSDNVESQRYYWGKVSATFPLFKTGDLELGMQSNFTRFSVKQALQFYDPKLVDQASDFGVDQWKHAFYGEYKQKKGAFEYSLGARYQHFDSQAQQKNLDSSFSQVIHRIFPSLQVLYTWGKRQNSLGFSYSRRINPPDFFDLNPFIFYQDPLNLETGNPFLKPALAHIYELSYAGLWKELSWDMTLFYRYETNSIQDVVEQLDEERTLRTYQNFGRKTDIGLEVQVDYSPKEWINLSANGSAYQTRFPDDGETVRFPRQWAGTIQFRQLVKLKKEWQIELKEIYKTPRLGPQMRYLSQYYIDFSIRKSFAKRRGNCTLSFRDILNTRIFAREFLGSGFRVENQFKFQSQQITWSIRYKLFK